MSTRSDYNFNFFRPKTAFSRDNSKLISVIVIVWLVAVFGFQLLLKMTESPCPEKGYLSYQKIAEKFEVGQLNASDKLELTRINLSLMSRYVGLRNNQALKVYTSVLIHDLMPETEKEKLISYTKINNSEIPVDFIVTGIGMDSNDLRAYVIPYAVTAFEVPENIQTEIEKMAPLMKNLLNKYMVHNRSFLTDSTFLGFPFHYFYTSELLLFIFIGLCLVYCFIFQRILNKHGME